MTVGFQTPREPDYSLLPEAYRNPARQYIERGIVPSVFLTCCIAGEIGRISPENGGAAAIVTVWLRCYAPTLSHGSLELMYSWVAQGGTCGAERARQRLDVISLDGSVPAKQAVASRQKALDEFQLAQLGDEDVPKSERTSPHIAIRAIFGSAIAVVGIIAFAVLRWKLHS